jgi:hypothetical protein
MQSHGDNDQRFSRPAPRYIGVPQQPDPRQPLNVAPQPRGPRRLRPEWLCLPFVIAGLLWLAHAGAFELSWDDVLYRLGILDRPAFSRLTALALVLAGALAGLRILLGR